MDFLKGHISPLRKDLFWSGLKRLQVAQLAIKQLFLDLLCDNNDLNSLESWPVGFIHRLYIEDGQTLRHMFVSEDRRCHLGRFYHQNLPNMDRKT